MAMSPSQRPRGVLGFWASLMTALGNTENMPVSFLITLYVTLIGEPLSKFIVLAECKMSILCLICFQTRSALCKFHTVIKFHQDNDN